MKAMKVVGIIGPYISGKNRRLIDHNIANAVYVTIAIANRFALSRLVGFFAPHSHTARFEKLAQAPESYYHALDDAIYDSVCKGFILLPDWVGSEGARRDYKRAVDQGKSVFPLGSYRDEDINKLLDLLELWTLSSEADC
ncbi:MAG: hypothetical protein Q8R29_03060 [bacterium]|nr:hypothetical protein [bacterium]